MKKILLPAIILFTLIFAACNNAANDAPVAKKDKSSLDSLEGVIEDGHNIGMSKMGRLSRAENEVNRLLDSISKLPSRASEAAAPYKAKLNSLLEELNSADSGMNKWMEEYRFDTLKNDIAGRINYLLSETPKVEKIKASILEGLDKADSLLKRKF